MNVDINRFLLGIDTTISINKKKLVNDRKDICYALNIEVQKVKVNVKKKSNQDLMDLYFTPIMEYINGGDDIIKKALIQAKMKGDVILKISKAKKDYYPFILYLCTGKDRNILFKDFKVLTKLDFKRQQVGDFYGNIDKNKAGLSQMDTAIFKGINKMKKDIPLYDPDKKDTLFKYVEGEAKNVKEKKRKYIVAINTINIILKNKEMIFQDIQDVYNRIENGKDRGQKAKLNRINIFNFLTDKDNKKDFNYLFTESTNISSVYGFDNKSMSILFSSTLSGNFKVKDIITDTIKTGKRVNRNVKKYTIIRDSPKMMKLKRIQMRNLVLPKIEQFENYSESSLEDNYIAYLKHNGFRK
jgi:hypothetical protein